MRLAKARSFMLSPDYYPVHSISSLSLVVGLLAHSEWNLLEEALSNSNYFGYKAYVIGYNSIPYSTPHVPSNEIDRKSAFKAMSRQYIRAATPLRRLGSD